LRFEARGLLNYVWARLNNTSVNTVGSIVVTDRDNMVVKVDDRGHEILGDLP